MVKTVQDYTDLVTSEHNQQPNYMATLEALIQPLVDTQEVTEHLRIDFDLDFAVGVQLDAIGVRVNRDRFVPQPLNVYFSVGVEGLGVGEGYLKGPFDPVSGLVMLPDEPYRTVLRAVIQANFWDGTIPGAYAAYNTLLPPAYGVLIQDWDNLSMGIALIGFKPDAITKALFTSGALDLKPAGVTLKRMLPTIYPASTIFFGGTPLFGIGVQNARIAGVGYGQLVKTVSTE